jgi:hypothetical protein
MPFSALQGTIASSSKKFVIVLRFWLEDKRPEWEKDEGCRMAMVDVENRLLQVPM